MNNLALIIISLLAALVSISILGLVVGAFAEPTSSFYAVVGSVVWATFGPFLWLATFIALLLGIVVISRGHRRLGWLVLASAIASLLGAGYIVFQLGRAASAAGGEIDVRASFLLEDMDVPSPDVVETFAVVDGTELRVALHLPPFSDISAPIIGYIHGGGFMTGSYTETAADLRWFADRGWLVASFEYRLFKPNYPTWDKAHDDVACALVWIGQNASRFGGDPLRLALLGDSAGGNLAINMGFAAAADEATSTCEGSVAVPTAIAVQYPALDPTSIYEDGFPVSGFEPKMLIEGYIGGSPANHPERVEAISSATYLTRDAPPTLIILPEKDSLVPAQGTLAFVQDANAAGLDIELVQIPFANHVFNQIAANSLGNQIGRTVRLRFLEQHVH